jgi:hypothetical protein
MPSIIPAGASVPDIARHRVVITSLDDLRREPGRLVFAQDLHALKIVSSYDGLKRLVDSGRLPIPYRIGHRPAWEARAVLQMLGAPETIPDAEAALEAA